MVKAAGIEPVGRVRDASVGGGIVGTTQVWTAPDDRPIGVHADGVNVGAGNRRRGAPWAADIYARARARGMRHPHAVRVLARAWTLVIWKAWQTHTPYDPHHHGGLNRYLEQTAAAAA